MALIDDLRTNLGQLNDSAFVKRLIAEQQALHRPELEQTFKSVDADLNRRGLFSASPVSRARFQAASQFQTGIAKNVQTDVARQRAQLLPLLAQLELAERQGRRQDKAGILKLIGTVVGTGAGFLLGGPPGAVAGAGLGRNAFNTYGGSFGSGGKFVSGVTFNPTLGP